jgi:hypothetical protein
MRRRVGAEMLAWLKSVRARWAERRAARRVTRGERTLKQNEAKAQRLRHERMDDKGPLGPGI